jgi:PKD repeat protein
MGCCPYFSGIAQTPVCTAEFTYSVTVNNTVNFIAKDTIGIRHHWLFGDGEPATVSTNASVSHHYSQPGKYEVKHFIENTNAGCRDSVVKVVSVPVSDSSGGCTLTTNFHYRKDSIDCRKIFFAASYDPAAGNIQFAWNFGDGGTSHDIAPVHTYAQPGKYYVCLVIESGNNCRKEFCDSVIANCETACNIAVKYEYAKDSVDCKRIHFTSQPVPVVANIHFSWNFGDGTVSHDANPVHAYAQPGNYYVCLVSETGSNCRREFCDSIRVNCETVCSIYVKYQHRNDSMNCKKIQFVNQSVAASSAVHFTWNFGDGTISHDINPAHVYDHPGRYFVCLVAEAGNNCRKEYCDSLSVNCPVSCNTIARFEPRHDKNQWNLIYFNNVSGPVSNVWQTYWSYGDGSSSRDYNSFHEYTSAGLYQVCLKVISLDKCTSSYCDTVRVVKPVNCDNKALFYHDSSSKNLIVNFEALYQNSKGVYYWDFGDGTAGPGKHASHAYMKAGHYKVCLTVKDDSCAATHCEEITVNPESNSGRIMLFPNPAVNTVSLVVRLDASGQVSIRLLDGNGGVKANYQKNGLAGSNTFSLPVEKLSQGIYLVEIKTSNGVTFSRFVKG